ncbi:MFS transporter [Wukongibacter baidiensis]|uniref:MFS transporter n=1 Tax=Wukongibacter baidiensis TaxID=1723361 RepID=UPI003D7F97B1
MEIAKNIRTYKLYSAFTELLILGPIIVLYYIAKGLSFTEIMILQSIGAVAVVLFEVPTGAVADKIGRRYSIVLGALLWGLSLFIYTIGKSFYSFAVGEIIFSLGGAFKSGADTALIYDSLKELKRENEFQRIEGSARSLIFYTQGIGAIIAGFIYEVNIHLPMIVSIGFMIITAIIAMNFKEPHIEGKEGRFGANYFTQIKESGRYILGHEKIKAIILYSMIFFIFFRAGFWYYQPYMESVDIPVKYFGLIFFMFNIVAALASNRCYKIMEFTKPKTLTFMSGLLIVSFILLGFIKVWIGVLAILLQQVARGLYRPVTRKYMNKHIPSDKRATILSFHSLAVNLAVAATLPFMGILKDNVNIYTTHIVLAVVMIIMTYMSKKYMDKRLGVKEKQVERGDIYEPN